MGMHPAMDNSQSAQSNDMSHPSWTSYNPSQHSPPMGPIPAYHGFGYGPTPYSMSIPPPYSSLSLAMPPQPWPSMLAGQPQYLEQAIPTTSMTASASAPTTVPSVRKLSVSGPTPRRTLSDDDRRRMCRFHEQNRTAKQSDIGALFGVERSTVSKVLRQKDKYLNPKEDNRSPAKKTKRKVPDIEKAVYNWVVKRQQRGDPLTDELTKEKAVRFASTCGNADREKVLNPDWLEDFKQKHNLTDMTSQRRSSANAKKSRQGSPLCLHIDVPVDTSLQTPMMASPVSADELSTPSPLSPTHVPKSMQKEEGGNVSEDRPCRSADSNSNSNSYDASASLSSSVTSPSTLISGSPFTPNSQSNMSFIYPDFQRPRSQTFPFTAVDPSLISADGNPIDSFPHRQASQPSLSVTGLEASFEGDAKLKPELDSSYGSQQQDGFNAEMRPPSMNKPPIPQHANDNTSPSNFPNSPTQEQARQAVELLINYFQHLPSGLAAQDYLNIGKLTQMLEIVRNNPQMLPEGLAQVDEQDFYPMNKKRSIHALG